jgi:hypothetical protein
MKFEFDTTKLKEQVEDNPLFALGAVAGILAGGAKLMNALTARKNAKTWSKEVNRRTKTKK